MSGNAPETASSERGSTADYESNNGDVSMHSPVACDNDGMEIAQDSAGNGSTIIEQESQPPLSPNTLSFLEKVKLLPPDQQTELHSLVRNMESNEVRLKEGKIEIIKDYDNKVNMDKSKANTIQDCRTKGKEEKIAAFFELIDYLKANKTPRGLHLSEKVNVSSTGEYREGIEFINLKTVLGRGSCAGDIVVVKDIKLQTEHAMKTGRLITFAMNGNTSDTASLGVKSSHETESVSQCKTEREVSMMTESSNSIDGREAQVSTPDTAENTSTCLSSTHVTTVSETQNGDVCTNNPLVLNNDVMEITRDRVRNDSNTVQQQLWRKGNLGYESSQASAIPRFVLRSTDEKLLNRLYEDLASKDVELVSNAEGQITKLIYKREKLKQDMRRNYRNPYKVYKCDNMECTREYVSSFLEFIEDFKTQCPPGGVVLPGACAEARQNGVCNSKVVFHKHFVNSDIFVTVCKEDTNSRTFHFKKTVKVFDFRRPEIDCWLDLNESDSFPRLYLCGWDGSSVYMYSEAILPSVMLEVIIKQHALEPKLRRPFSLYIFHELLCIIKESHDKDWTHRDISGHNVLFTTDDMKVRKLKVVDFGRAEKRNIHQQNENPKLNYTGIQHDIVNATKLFTDLYCDNALAEFHTLFPQMKDKTIYSAIKEQVQITEEQKLELEKLIRIVYATIADAKQDFGNISSILRCIENACAEVVSKHVMMKAVEYLFPFYAELVGIAMFETPWDGDGQETEPFQTLHGNTSSTTESCEKQTLNELTFEKALETLKTDHPELFYPFSLCMFQRQLKDLQNLHEEKRLGNFISATVMLMENPVRVAFQTRDQDSDFSISGVKGDILSVIRNLYNIYRGAECYKENDTLESHIINGNIEKTLETDEDKSIWRLVSLAYESIKDERKVGFGDIAPILKETEKYIFLYDKTKTLQSEEVLKAMPKSAFNLSDLKPSVPEMGTMENIHTLEPREQNPRPVLESGIPAPPPQPQSMLRVRPSRESNLDQNSQGTELDNLRGGNNTLDLTGRVASLSVQSEKQKREDNAQ